jgi:undecaprenyl diphosphate synthase
MPATPDHIAIVMDGNGRWAEQRKRPRNLGHQAGLKALKKTAEHCARSGVKTLTVFAFSSENWQRPKQEVTRLMELFLRALDREVKNLHQNGIRLTFIGDRGQFPPEIQERMDAAEELTRNNDGMILNVAANYGGRWDIVQAARRAIDSVSGGRLEAAALDEETFAGFLSTAELPEPDLLIRTGGEMRISNFLLWQCAYSEMYFTPVLWPDFDADQLDQALAAYRSRERRFGRTGEQIRDIHRA